MTAERHKRVEAIFLAVAELPRDQWERVLAERCAGEPELESEVRSLLGFHARADQFLDDREIKVHGLALDPGPDEALAPGTRVGEYSIVRLVGTGGMGHVYVAEQDRPRRTVAVKVIRRSMISHSLFRRFEHEAEVLGRLHHPGIAQIYEAGVATIGTELPQPFIAMELVNGRSLTQHCDEHGLNSRARLELLARVCDAVHHAHQRGIIHRDLKPANILVDEQHQPKVLDFGVARAADADLRVTTLQTSVGQLIGTLPYMSPEQVIGDPSELDTRSDVYALGVVLYELLTGKLPYDFRSRALPEAARLIRDEAPARLSTIDRTLRGDVETIVNKALAKDKARRYQSAADLAADIRAFLEGKPIAARQDSALYVLGTQMRRHKGAVAAGAAALLGLVAFAVYASVQARVSARLARAAQEELISSTIERGRSLGLAGNIGAAEDLLWPEMLRRPESRRTFFALWELYSRERCEATIPLTGRAESHRMRLSPDGGRLAVTGGVRPGLVTLIDTDRLEPEGQFDAVGGEGGTDVSISFSRTGRLLTGDARGRVAMWDADQRRLIGEVWSAGHAVVDLACHPGMDRAAVLLDDGTLTLISLERAPGSPSSEPIATWKRDEPPSPGTDGRPMALAFAPAGDRVAVSFRDGRVWVVSGSDLRPRLTIRSDEQEGAGPLAFSADGSRLASARVSRAVRIWDAHTGEALHTLQAANGGVRGLSFSSDGSRLMAIGWWYLQVWDLATQRVVQTSATRTAGGDLAVSPDGRVVYADIATAIGVWELDPHAGHTIVDGQPQSRTLACFTPTGDLISGDGNGNVRLLTDPGGDEVALLGTGSRRIRAIRFSPTAPIAAVADSNGVLMLLDAQKRVKLAEWPEYWMPTNEGLSFDSSGSRLALPAKGGVFKVISIPDGTVLLTLPSDKAEPLSARFSPDDSVIACVRRRAPIRLFDARSGALLRECELASTSNWCVAFTPDGSQVLSGTWSRTIDVWDVATGRLVRRLSGHRGLVMGLAFRPREPMILASSGGDGQIMLWDLSLPQNTPVMSIGGFDDWEVWALDFDPPGRRIIGTNSLGLSVIWDLRYFNRHIGGNMVYQLNAHRGQLGPDFDEAAAMNLRELLLNRGGKPR